MRGHDYMSNLCLSSSGVILLVEKNNLNICDEGEGLFDRFLIGWLCSYPSVKLFSPRIIHLIFSINKQINNIRYIDFYLTSNHISFDFLFNFRCCFDISLRCFYFSIHRLLGPLINLLNQQHVIQIIGLFLSIHQGFGLIIDMLLMFFRFIVVWKDSVRIPQNEDCFANSNFRYSRFQYHSHVSRWYGL